jgi:hypothetical protein
MKSNYNNYYNSLIGALKLVAADYSEQVNSMPSFVIEVADDIANTFGEAFHLTNPILEAGMITKEVAFKLKELDGLFEMEDEYLWEKEALKSSPQWEKIRLLATEILENLYHYPPYRLPYNK